MIHGRFPASLMEESGGDKIHEWSKESFLSRRKIYFCYGVICTTLYSLISCIKLNQRLRCENGCSFSVQFYLRVHLHDLSRCHFLASKKYTVQHCASILLFTKISLKLYASSVSSYYSNTSVSFI